MKTLLENYGGHYQRSNLQTIYLHSNLLSIGHQHKMKLGEKKPLHCCMCQLVLSVHTQVENRLPFQDRYLYHNTCRLESYVILQEKFPYQSTPLTKYKNQFYNPAQLLHQPEEPLVAVQQLSHSH